MSERESTRQRAMASALAAVLALGAVAAPSLFPAPYPAVAQTPVGQPEAHDIAVNAYLYLYPLVTMDLTRRQMTNLPAGQRPGFGPPNTFHSIPTYPTVTEKVVVRPNFDTLYSVAWLDLAKEPVVVSVPDTKGRYYLLPMLDMWTDVFASPGWRTTGTQAQHLLVAPPGWRPDLRDRIVEELRLPEATQRIDAPTSHVWIIGRIKTDGPQDYDAVHEIQAGLKVTPLSEWGWPPRPVEARTDPGVDMSTTPKQQVEAMPAHAFFRYAAELMSTTRPHLTDEPILAQIRKIGIRPGAGLDMDKLSPQVKKALEDAPATAQKLMAWKLPTLARVANHWSMNTSTMGVYGNDYLRRAIIAQQGLGANLPRDAIYPFNLGDQAGRPLDGAHKYVLHFEKGELPPVDAFWSVTLYDPAGYQVANPLDRFALSSWMPLKYEPDGSLTLYVQNESPGAGKEANWLPAPKAPFNLTMRLYAPKPAALVGKWNPPPVTRTEAFLGITGQ